MAIIASLFIVPLTLLFLFSGIIVNLLQAVVYVLVRPFSKKLYRRLNKVVAELLWLEFIWLADWWAFARVELFADSDTYQLMGKEHALVICNHGSDVDWLVGWILAQRVGCLGSVLAVLKKELKLVPIVGWSMWFSDYVFLARSWAKDANTLKSGFQQLEDFPMPFWVALFVEGTRLTPERLFAAQNYAESRGLPVPRNVLVPRTKGFVSAVTSMRQFVPAIYDCTIGISRDEPPPKLFKLFRQQPFALNVQIERHLMTELPETADGIAQWCKDVFVSKDAFLENFHTKGKFSDLQCHDIGRPKKSLMVVIGWCIVLVVGIVKFVLWSSLLSTWQGIAFSVVFLVVTTIVMQTLVQCSDVNSSNPSKCSAKEKLLH